MITREDLSRQLQEISTELATKDELVERRDELVELARSQVPPMTWREIGRILGMTEQGLIKAQKAYQARSKASGSTHRATA